MFKRFGRYHPPKLLSFGSCLFGPVGELFGDFGGFQRNFPQREEMKEETKREEMPREVYLRNTRTMSSLTGEKFFLKCRTGFEGFWSGS